MAVGREGHGEKDEERADQRVGQRHLQSSAAGEGRARERGSEARTDGEKRPRTNVGSMKLARDLSSFDAHQKREDEHRRESRHTVDGALARRACAESSRSGARHESRVVDATEGLGIDADAPGHRFAPRHVRTGELDLVEVGPAADFGEKCPCFAAIRRLVVSEGSVADAALSGSSDHPPAA